MLNNDFENNQESAESNQTKSETAQTAKVDKSDKRRRFLTIFSIVSITLLIFAIFVINYDSFSKFFAKVSDVISVLNSVFIGIAIAYLLNPIYKFFNDRVFRKMKSKKANKALSIVLTYVLIIAFISGFFLITVPQVAKSLNEMPAKLHEFAMEASVQLQAHLENIQNSEFYKSIVEIFDLESMNIEETINNFLKRLLNMENILQKIADSALGIVGNIYVVIKDILLGLILSIYLLAAKESLKAQGKKMVLAVMGEKKAKNSLEVLSFTDKTFGGFIQGKIINAIIIGFLTFFAFAAFKIPYPQLLTIIVAVTDLIPVFGPFIGAVPCAFVVLIAAPAKVIPMLLLILIIQQLDGNYIGPKILGESTGISALGVFLAVIIMGGYFGIAGMILGIPIFAVASALIQKAIDRKLEKRKYPTDIEKYYADGKFIKETKEKKNMLAKLVDAIKKGAIISGKAIKKFFKHLPKIRKRPKKVKTANKKDENSESKEESASDTNSSDNNIDSEEPDKNN